MLVEQYRHGWGVTSIELPTGGIEAADADPVAAGRRELAVETGLTAARWERIAMLAPNAANQSNRCHVLFARGVAGGATPADDPTERVRVRRLPVEEVVRLAREGGIVPATHVAARALTRFGRWALANEGT